MSDDDDDVNDGIIASRCTATSVTTAS